MEQVLMPVIMLSILCGNTFTYESIFHCVLQQKEINLVAC